MSGLLSCIGFLEEGLAWLSSALTEVGCVIRAR